MSMQDPISDLLTRIRNAQNALIREISVSASKLKIAIAKVLKEEGYIRDYRITNEHPSKPMLEIALKYDNNNKPVIDKIKRISRPGLRIYKPTAELDRVSGFGIQVISTSQGVMTDSQARKLGIGGEILCEVA